MADVSYSPPGNVPTAFWVQAVNIGIKYGVDPYLLAAISKHETNYGTLGAGKQGFSLGVGVYDTGTPNSNYQDSPGSYTKQLTWAANSIKTLFGPSTITQDSIKAYQTRSGYATDPAWAKGVWSDYQSLNMSGSGTVGQAIWTLENTLNGEAPKGIIQSGGEVVDNIKANALSGAAGIASGATYVLLLLVIAGVALFAGTKMFTLKG